MSVTASQNPSKPLKASFGNSVILLGTLKGGDGVRGVQLGGNCQGVTVRGFEQPDSLSFSLILE